MQQGNQPHLQLGTGTHTYLLKPYRMHKYLLTGVWIQPLSDAKQGTEQVSKVTEWVTIKKMAFYSSLDHSSIPFQLSETSLNCTNQSIRAEIVPPITWTLSIHRQLVSPIGVFHLYASVCSPIHLQEVLDCYLLHRKGQSLFTEFSPRIALRP